MLSDSLQRDPDRSRQYGDQYCAGPAAGGSDCGPGSAADHGRHGDRLFCRLLQRGFSARGYRGRRRTAGRGIRPRMASGVPVPGSHRPAGGHADIPAHTDPDGDGDERGELPACLRYAGNLSVLRRYPYG